MNNRSQIGQAKIYFEISHHLLWMEHKQGYEVEIHDDVIVRSETPQAAPKARVQPSFKNWHTMKFRCLFVAFSHFFCLRPDGRCHLHQQAQFALLKLGCRLMCQTLVSLEFFFLILDHKVPCKLLESCNQDGVETTFLVFEC